MTVARTVLDAVAEVVAEGDGMNVEVTATVAAVEEDIAGECVPLLLRDASAVSEAIAEIDIVRETVTDVVLL